MESSSFLSTSIKNLESKILNDFNKSLVRISYFDLWYKIFKFFGRNLELFSYKKSRKNFIFYKDKKWVNNHIAVYKALDKNDFSSWTVIEILIWETNKKDIIFLSENKIYNIIENKWGKVLDSSIIEDQEKIQKLLSFIEQDINYITNKTRKYQSKLRQKWVLDKQIKQTQIDKFKINFDENILKKSLEKPLVV